MISNDLRQAIRSRQETESLFAISKATQIPYATLHGFLSGSQVKSDRIDSLAAYLGLSLQPTEKPKAKAKETAIKGKAKAKETASKRKPKR